MQKPGQKVDLAKTEAEIRLTTGLEESTQPEFRAKVEGEATTQQEFRVSTQTDIEVGLDEGFHSDRLLDSGTDTHTGGSTGTSTQSETRQKTQSGELSSLERHADPDGTIGCNTCQEDLIDAITEQCKINVGDVIASRYEIKTYLGEGGMSAVYAAVDKVIKRDVALKILHRDLLVRGKGSLLRFQREAQALGNLDHPNIVKIHHFDADENAQPYIVMDIVKGEPLSRRLVKDPESVRFTDIIDIFVQVCDALSHAHSRGVVHRDLKPSNIMVIGNQVKVLDFGIAKLMSEDSDQELQLTRTGEVFGSPLYMSPEQCRGLKLDYRSDIYSLGCVMYEAFTGNPPFTGNSHIDTMLKHVNDLPASVVSSMCDARYVEKVDAILLRCMAKNPNARFQSMDEVKAALLELDRETKGPIEKVKQKLELIRLKLGAQGKLTPKLLAVYASIALLTTGLGASVVMSSFHQGLSKSELQVSHWKDIDLEGQKAFDKGDFKAADLSFNKGLEIAKGLKHSGLRLASINGLVDLERAKAILDPSTANRTEQLAKRIQYEKELLAEKTSREKAAISLIGELKKLDPKAPDSVDVARAALETAQETTDAGFPKVAIRLIEEVLSVATMANNAELLGSSHMELGHAYLDSGNRVSARKELETALQIREKALKEFDPDIARTLVLLAHVMEPSESFPLLRRALKIQSTAFYPTSHQVGWVHDALAHQYLDVGQLNTALREAETAVTILRAAAQRNQEGTERNKAMDFLSKALLLRGEIRSKILAADLLTSAKNKVPVKNLDERRQAISADFDESLAVVEQINPKTAANATDDMISWLLCEQGKALKAKSEEFFANGDANGASNALEQAKFRFARALAISQRLPLEMSNRKQAELYAWLGRVYRAVPDLPLAKASFAKAKSFSDTEYGVNSQISSGYQNELNAIQRDLGQKQ